MYPFVPQRLSERRQFHANVGDDLSKSDEIHTLGAAGCEGHKPFASQLVVYALSCEL